MTAKATSHQFQAETKQVLDIVVNSLYKDKEIFVRELISNASDALEKLRRKQLTEKEVFDENLELEINVSTDDSSKQNAKEMKSRFKAALRLPTPHQP